MKKLVKFVPVFALAAFVPMIAFADDPSYNGLVFIIHKIQDVLNALLPALIALGVVLFVWGVVQYVIGDSEEAKKKGRDHMLFGIIGLAVIVGLWGLIYIVVDTFGIDAGAPQGTQIQKLLPQ